MRYCGGQNAARIQVYECLPATHGGSKLSKRHVHNVDLGGLDIGEIQGLALATGMTSSCLIDRSR